jgi:hypothetical protein
MTELYATVNERRVFCGRCRHERNQTRVEGGIFDSENGLTFHCGDCQAVYAVCKYCGWFMSDGAVCARCAETPSVLLAVKEPTTVLPPFLKNVEHELIADPAGRAGHWYHPRTDTTISMGLGWVPKGGAKAPMVDAGGEEIEDLSGKSVMILQGRFEGKKGVISENGLGDDQQGLTVIEEGGTELTFESFEPYLRFMTPSEAEKADAEAQTAKKAQAEARKARAAEKLATRAAADSQKVNAPAEAEKADAE